MPPPLLVLALAVCVQLRLHDQLAFLDGAGAGAIHEGAVLLVLADDGTRAGEQALMTDQYLIVQALDEEDMTGIRFGEVDGRCHRKRAVAGVCGAMRSIGVGSRWTVGPCTR